jgi:DNA-binding FadR family transcriptional regulator
MARVLRDPDPWRPQIAGVTPGGQDPVRVRSRSVAEHERITQAITDGDPDAGARTMREHILSVQAQQSGLSDPV